MLGAIALRMRWKRMVEEAFARRDIEAMLRGWTDDAVVEIGGTHGMAGRYVGKPEIQGRLRRWFGAVDELELRVGRVALARPWAIGLTNTVMWEATVHQRDHNGTTVEEQLLVVTELRRGRIAGERAYLFDETPELVMWGRRPTGQQTSAA